MYCFNPHTHEGCDLANSSTYLRIARFQSTHPRRVWPIWFVPLVVCINQFQSTHPRRVWLSMLCLVMYLLVVSIHTPTKGVTKQLAIKASEQMFQSTHPRRVWRFGSLWPAMVIIVSIHTPTKGVTDDDGNIVILTPVSIHTPTKGVTSIGFTKKTTNQCFNPHTHEGCDKNHFLKRPIYFRFNPHTHEGCD